MVSGNDASTNSNNPTVSDESHTVIVETSVFHIDSSISTSPSGSKQKESGKNDAIKNPAGPSAAGSLPDASDEYAEHLKTCSWPSASYLILGETFGTGVLGLPKAMANLGWVFGIASIILFGLASRYSGQLLYRVKTRCFPNIMSYGEAGNATANFTVGRVLAFLIQLNWFLLMPYYLVAGATSLSSALSDGSSPVIWQYTLIFAAPLLLLTQLKSLSSISWLSGLSTLSIIAVCVIAVATILSSPAPPDTSVSIGIPANATFFDTYTDMSSFIFAFQGQDMHYEIMREMKQVSNYPRAYTSASIVMILAYGGVSAAIYSVWGDKAPDFLLDAIPDGPWKITAAALSTFHVLVAYLLVSQPLVDKLYRAMLTIAAAKNPSSPPCSSLTRSILWGGLTTLTLLLGLLIANIIPFFNDFQNLLGALLGSLIVFGAPAFFFLRGYKILGIRKAWLDTALACIFLFLIFPFCTVLGTYLSVDSILLKWLHHDAAV